MLLKAAKACRMLTDVKTRAYQQIKSALEQMQKDGYIGNVWSWWDNDGKHHECKAYHLNLYVFRLCEWAGEDNVACFYNDNTRRWDYVLNMPINDLANCADSFVYYAAYKQWKNKRTC